MNGCHLSKNHDTLILEGYYGNLPIVFNLRDGQSNRLYTKNYVESFDLFECFLFFHIVSLFSMVDFI